MPRRIDHHALLRAQADAAEARLREHGLTLQDLGVLPEDDPAAARFLTTVERGFYEDAPTGGHLAQILAGHAEDGRRRLAVLPAGEDPAEHGPVGTFEDFVQPLTTWPGRTVDACLISDITVDPGHRRRGILRAMMLRSLADAAAAGVPVAALTASEAAIYGRFGFGVATRWRRVHLDVAHEPLLHGPAPAGSVRRADPREIPGLVDGLYQRVRVLTPGTAQRTTSRVPLWEDRSLGKNDGQGSGLYSAVHRDAAGDVQGAVLYRFEGWEKDPTTVSIEAFLAITPDARRGLLEHLVRLDLVDRVAWNRAPEPGWVEACFADERRVRTERAGDDLYLRVLDVPRAVAARGYAQDGEVTVAVEDPLALIEGTWLLTVHEGEGAAERLGPASEAAALGADLVLRADQFSGLWLGGHSRGAGAAVLADAGTVRELTPGAGERLDGVLRPVRPLHTLTGF